MDRDSTGAVSTAGRQPHGSNLEFMIRIFQYLPFTFPFPYPMFPNIMAFISAAILARVLCAASSSSLIAPTVSVGFNTWKALF